MDLAQTTVLVLVVRDIKYNERRNIMKNSNFKNFLCAFAEGEYKQALSLWDKYHKDFVGNDKVVADTIIKLLDCPKPLF